jgi:hypothetical protein
VHAPRAELDEEEHVQAAEPERLDGEELAGDHRRGTGTEELTPTQLGASAGRGNTHLRRILATLVAETR